MADVPRTTIKPTPDEITDEVESVRNHLYTALGSVALLVGHIPNALDIKEHITRALTALPKKGSME